MNHLIKSIFIGILSLTLFACGKGGGTDSGVVTAKIDGRHVATFSYSVPGSNQRVENEAVLQISQAADGSINGSISFIESLSQAENCYFAGEFDSGESSISGNTVRLVVNDLRPGESPAETDENGAIITEASSFKTTLTINGRVNGRFISGSFNATRGVCGERTGEFSSSF